MHIHHILAQLGHSLPFQINSHKNVGPRGFLCSTLIELYENVRSRTPLAQCQRAVYAYVVSVYIYCQFVSEGIKTRGSCLELVGRPATRVL